MKGLMKEWEEIVKKTIKEFKWYFLDFWKNPHMDQTLHLGRNSSPSGQVGNLFPLFVSVIISEYLTSCMAVWQVRATQMD